MKENCMNHHVMNHHVMNHYVMNHHVMNQHVMNHHVEKHGMNVNHHAWSKNNECTWLSWHDMFMNHAPTPTEAQTIRKGTWEQQQSQ